MRLIEEYKFVASGLQGFPLGCRKIPRTQGVFLDDIHDDERTVRHTIGLAKLLIMYAAAARKRLP
jgi:hypothetical protein